MAGTPAAPLSPDAGPTDPHLPKLPSGWIAQWDSSSRKYYYVQISTGVSQWELPTSEAPAGPSRRPEQIPASALENAGMADPAQGTGGKPEEYSGDRGLGSTAFNLLASQHGGGKQSSGLGGLATSLLNSATHGSNSHGSASHSSSSGHNSGTAGLVGSLASGLLGSSKPHGQQQGGHSSSSGSHQSSGLGGMLGGILGGSHGSHAQQSNNYGYSSGAPSSGGYSGTAPPTQYNPSGSASHTPSNGAAYPGQPGYNNQYSSPNSQAAHNQYAPPPHTASYSHQPQHAPSFGPQSTPSWGPQSTPSFPPPPTQPQQHHQGGYVAAQHDQPQNHSGYFTQGPPQGAYGQQGGYSGGNQYPPPPPGAPPSGSYNTATYGQPSPHGGYSQQPVHHQQGYGQGYGSQPPNGQHGAYGHAQHQTGYHGTSGAPPQPGW